MIIARSDPSEQPDEPEEAFVYLEEKARRELDRNVERGGNGWHHELDYMADVLGAADALGIEALQDWQIPTVDDSSVGATYTSFRRAVRRLCMAMQVRIARRIKEHSVAFDPETKVKLRALLDQMREAVDNEPHLTPRKRDALYKKIANLAAEIDQDWSRSESYMELALEIASTAGLATEKLEPLRKFLQTVSELWGKALRDRDERPTLPPPGQHKRIPPPRRPVAAKGKGGFDKQLDDEIPF